jgi:hypothetical protein
MDLRGNSTLVWFGLSHVRSVSEGTRAVPWANAAGSRISDDGRSGVSSVDGVGCHARACHPRRQHGASSHHGAPVCARFRRIDGFNVIVLFVFVAAVMESLGVHVLTAPMITMALAALAFVVFFAVLLLSVLMFLSAGRERALALGFMASQRNMGFMLAATGGALPDLTWLYFALSQFPSYLSPQLLKPLTRRILGRALHDHAVAEKPET